MLRLYGWLIAKQSQARMQKCEVVGEKNKLCKKTELGLQDLSSKLNVLSIAKMYRLLRKLSISISLGIIEDTPINRSEGRSENREVRHKNSLVMVNLKKR